MPASPTHLIVDAMNVIGSRPDGWWRDREAAVRRLVGRLQRLARAEQRPVTVVIDGRPLRDLPEAMHGGVHVCYATRAGPNAADDRIVDLVKAHPDPASLVVITSDRVLAVRARAHGASVRGAGSLLERLDALDAGSAGPDGG
ncbi:MAG TPA: NYN domain-containing protein [Dehalococcoidia bacterium]|nr:NYN domain-containing protein [Dehalococcoidia bacterium]